MKKSLAMLILAAVLFMGAQFPRGSRTVSIYSYPDFLIQSPVTLSVSNNQLTVKNVSGRVIKYAEIEVEFPSTGLANSRLFIGSRHYLAPAIHAEDDAQPLRPNETRVLGLNLPNEKIRLAIVRPIIALFKNNAGWIVGYPVHRDQFNSAHWIVDAEFQAALLLPKPRFMPVLFGLDGEATTCYRFEGSMTVECSTNCSANVFTIRKAQDGFKQKQRLFSCTGEGCGAFMGDDTNNAAPCYSLDVE